jgi:hypothetical protein
MTFSWIDDYPFGKKSYLCSSLEVSEEADSGALIPESAKFIIYKAQEQLIRWAALLCVYERLPTSGIAWWAAHFLMPY